MNDADNYRPRPTAQAFVDRFMAQTKADAGASYEEVYQSCYRELEHRHRSQGEGSAMWRNGMDRKTIREEARRMARERMREARKARQPRYVPIAPKAD